MSFASVVLFLAFVGVFLEEPLGFVVSSVFNAFALSSLYMKYAEVSINMNIKAVFTQ